MPKGDVLWDMAYSGKTLLPDLQEFAPLMRRQARKQNWREVLRDLNAFLDTALERKSRNKETEKQRQFEKEQTKGAQEFQTGRDVKARGAGTDAALLQRQIDVEGEQISEAKIQKTLEKDKPTLDQIWGLLEQADAVVGDDAQEAKLVSQVSTLVRRLSKVTLEEYPELGGLKDREKEVRSAIREAQRDSRKTKEEDPDKAEIRKWRAQYMEALSGGDNETASKAAIMLDALEPKSGWLERHSALTGGGEEAPDKSVPLGTAMNLGSAVSRGPALSAAGERLLQEADLEPSPAWPRRLAAKLGVTAGIMPESTMTETGMQATTEPFAESGFPVKQRATETTVLADALMRGDPKKYPDNVEGRRKAKLDARAVIGAETKKKSAVEKILSGEEAEEPAVEVTADISAAAKELLSGGYTPEDVASDEWRKFLYDQLGRDVFDEVIGEMKRMLQDAASGSE